MCFLLPACQARDHRCEHLYILKWNVHVGDAILLAPSLQRFYQEVNRADEQVGVFQNLRSSHSSARPGKRTVLCRLLPVLGNDDFSDTMIQQAALAAGVVQAV